MHTEGKLNYSDEYPNCLLSGNRMMASAASELDARRLVACWNEHDDLVKERDELVRVLRAYTNGVPGSTATAAYILAKYPES